MKYLLIILVIYFLAPTLVQAEPAEHTFRVLGLFDPQRQEDLRETVTMIPEIELVRIDYPAGEAIFLFDATALFPGAKKPEQLVAKFSEKLRQACRDTFEALVLSEFPKEKRQEVKIAIAGLDCRGCSYGAYLAVNKIDGVERVTASFQDGWLIAWIDPAKTDREGLEEALVAKKVVLAEK